MGAKLVLRLSADIPSPYVTHYLSNSAFYPKPDGKWVPANGQWQSSVEVYLSKGSVSQPYKVCLYYGW